MVRRRAGSGGRRAAERVGLGWGAAALVTVGVLAVLGFFRQEVGGTDASASSSGSAAPDFELTVYQGAEALGGEQLLFSEIFKQGKPVVLNFWAGLCPPCRAEIPGFQSVYTELSDQFVLVGVDVGPFVGLGSRDEGRNLLRDLNISYPAGTTFAASILADYAVRGMPTTVFLTATGEVVQTYSGLMSEAAFRAEVQDLIEAAGAQR